MKKKYIFLLTTLLGCQEVIPPTGACITNDLDPIGWYCDEDKEADRCNEEWADYVDLDLEFRFYPNKSCPDISYDHYCDYEDMAASGSSFAYYTSRFLSNSECNPSIGDFF